MESLFQNLKLEYLKQMDKTNLKKFRKSLKRKDYLKRVHDSKRISTSANIRNAEVVISPATNVVEVPISIIKIKKRNTPKNGMVLVESKKRGSKTANVYIAKGPAIVELIDRTNSQIINMHRKGEIDLSGDNL